MPTDFKTIIKNAMKSKGVTQEQLAKELGSYQQAVSGFLLGHRPMPMAKLEKCFDTLGLEVVEKL